MKPLKLFDVTGKTAILIAGANGLGKAIAIQYFASPIPEWAGGTTIFVNGRGEQTVEQG